jgi:hypothetical protein
MPTQLLTARTLVPLVVMAYVAVHVMPTVQLSSWHVPQPTPLFLNTQIPQHVFVHVPTFLAIAR